jgi:hypothetical protein
MWEMMPNLALEGTVMVFEEAITPNEVEDHLKDMLDHPMDQKVDLIIVYPILGHPLMHLDVGFIELVSCIAPSFPANLITDLIMVVCSSVFMSKPPIHHC